MAVFIVIPAHNEEQTVGEVVSGLRRELPSAVVLVVDDVSTDDTARCAARAGARVLCLPLRLGYWGALQTGLLYAWRQGGEVFVTMDADGQHLPEEVGRLLEPVARGQAEVAVGACPARAGAAKKVAWSFFRWLTGLPVRDLTSGFRAYGPRAVELLTAEDLLVFDNADLASLLLLHRAGLTISEVPVKMHTRRQGTSKLFSSPRQILHYLLVSMVLSLSKRKIS